LNRRGGRGGASRTGETDNPVEEVIQGPWGDRLVKKSRPTERQRSGGREKKKKRKGELASSWSKYSGTLKEKDQEGTEEDGRKKIPDIALGKTKTVGGTRAKGLSKTAKEKGHGTFSWGLLTRKKKSEDI